MPCDHNDIVGVMSNLGRLLGFVTVCELKRRETCVSSPSEKASKLLRYLFTLYSCYKSIVVFLRFFHGSESDSMSLVRSVREETFF